MKLQWIFSALLATATGILSAAPAIDGKLDDPEWAQARRFDRFYIHNSTMSGLPTEALLWHDANDLYIGFRCPVSADSELVAKATQRDGRVSADDAVEVMIDPGASGDRYCHVIVNTAGTLYDAYADQGGFVSDSKWNGEITAGTFRGTDFWSTEIRIPFSTLELSAETKPVWGFNFCRNQVKPPQLSATAPNGVFHVANAFLKVPGFDLDYGRLAWQISAPEFAVKQDGNGLTAAPRIRIANPGEKEQKIKLDLVLTGPGIAGATIDLAVPAHSQITADVPPITLPAPGAYTALIGILDPVTRNVLVRRNFPVQIAFAPLAVELITPHYRNAIFATQNLDEIVYAVHSSVPVEAITTGIADRSGKILLQRNLAGPGEVRIKTTELPEGQFTIFADAGTLGRIEHPLRKLPRRNGEVWRDREGFWRIDGKRVFMVTEWNDLHVPGVNASVHANPDCRLIDPTLLYSSFPAKKSFRQPIIDPPSEKIIRDTVKEKSINPELFAWYLADEPEVVGMSASGLSGAAEIIRDEDPYHPIILSNDTVSGLKDFGSAAEINGLHPYPNPAKGKQRPGFGRIVVFMDEAAMLNAGNRRPQSIFYLQQGFNYGDFGSLSSRIPTFDEIRTQFWMTTIMGGRGIMFYNRTTEHYPELAIGTPEIGREFAALQDMLTADDQPGGLTKGKLRTVIKKVGTNLWILAVSTQEAPFDYEFNIPELGGRKLQVWREGRSITPVNGRFSDRFDNFDVHIYTTDPDTHGLRTIAEVEQEIAARNTARRKPGNLAFQMFEHDRMTLRASSNHWLQGRADNTLWHVTDGVNLGDKSDAYGNQRTFFHDATPNLLPDWIELEFPEPVTVGRVVVYPVKHSLKDYEVQIWQNNDWKTVGRVKDAQGDFQEVKFGSEITAKIRVFITANRGTYTKIAEIEVYEQ